MKFKSKARSLQISVIRARFLSIIVETSRSVDAFKISNSRSDFSTNRNSL